MRRTEEEIVRAAYAAFNDRDIEQAVALMDPDVEWPDVVRGGVVRGRDGVRGHWREVFASAEPRIEVGDLERRPDRSIAAAVRQVVTGPDGQLISDDHLVHVFHIDDQLITRMDVEPTG
jgi:ketosteroid isomerase-like protein